MMKYMVRKNFWDNNRLVGINTRFLFSSAMLMASTSVIAADNKQDTDKYNFLVIVCEDISPYLGCYGDSVAVSPHLDNFSQDAIRHEYMFTCVGVSSPSRYSLITGRHSSTDGANYMRVSNFIKGYGVVPPDGVKCFSELMREQGYYTTNNAKTDYQFGVPVSAWDEQGNQAHWRHAPKDMPFLSIFNLNITHESQIWEQGKNELFVKPEDVKLPPYYPDNAVVRHDMAVMYSNIKRMDDDFQRLLAELEASDRADNTIVIFYSDNGGPIPRGKRELKDSGTRVPFMIRFPDRRGKGTTNEEMNMFVDVPATILSLANIKIPSYMHGRAMYGSQKGKERKFVFGATDRFDANVEKRASIRDKRYLYIYNYMNETSNYKPVAYRLNMPMMKNMVELYQKGELNAVQRLWFDAPAPREELYDCVEDPHQIHNLADIPAYQPLLKQMRKSFRKEWIQPYNKEWETHDEQYFINRSWPQGHKPQAEEPQYIVKDNKMKVLNASDKLSVTYQINGIGLNGDSKHWRLYTGEIPVKQGDVVKIRANRIGYKNSEIVTVSL